MKIEYERLIGRSVVNLLTRELQLAGIKMDINRFLRILIIGGLALFIITPFALFLGLGLNPALAAVAGIILAVIFEVAVYGVLEFNIEQRRTFMETLLPDYLQLAAANVRSGIALDKSMVLAARPEFGYFSEDVKEMNRELYGGETLQQPYCTPAEPGALPVGAGPAT